YPDMMMVTVMWSCSRILACRRLFVTSSLTSSLMSSKTFGSRSFDRALSHPLAAAGASGPALNRASSLVGIVQSQHAQIVDEIEALVEHRDQEDAMHDLGPRNDGQTPVGLPRPAVSLQHHAESRRIEERQSTEIEDEDRRLFSLRGEQFL